MPASSMTFVEWIASGNALYLGAQFAVTLSIAFGVLAFLTVCSIGMAITLGLNRTASNLVMSTAALLSSTPVVVVALILLYLGPASSLPYLLPIFLGFTPLIVCTLSGAETARNISSGIVFGYSGSVLREIKSIYLPFSLLGISRGLSLALPSVILGTLIGQMIDSDGLGQRLSAASRSTNSHQLFQVIVPLLLLALLLRALVGWSERALVYRFGSAEIDARMTQTVPIKLGQLVVSMAIPALTIVALGYLVAASMPNGVHIFRLPSWPASHALDVGPQSAAADTLGRVTTAFAASIGASYLICALAPRWRFIDQIFRLLAMVVQIVPAMFFLPLLAALSADYALNAVLVGSISGTYSIVEVVSKRRASWNEIEANRLQTQQSGWFRLEWHLLLPWSIASLLAGGKVAVPQIVSAILICEYINVGNGLGFLLNLAYWNSEFDQFGVVAISILLGTWAMLWLVTLLEFFLSRILRTTP